MPALDANTEISWHVKDLFEESLGISIPLELKLLSALVLLFLFLLFLIMLLWDRYGKEIGGLYTSPLGAMARGQGESDIKVHDVADEFSIYQKLPTFFYEYMPQRNKRN
ncbi:hypothetical protein CCR75_001197 [Bremia lactucae]|uniref:Uncharacterized protein n=1 Tax=Bremia lactucae TaxID=4779 RepID=A0A976FQA0_BRELC|nr:hypothetical protein CCR75_001197 [Bremia lactucae]